MENRRRVAGGKSKERLDGHLIRTISVNDWSLGPIVARVTNQVCFGLFFLFSFRISHVP